MSIDHCSSTSDLNEINGDPHRIWLGCLPTRITEFAILQLAKQFGELSDFHFPVHKAGDLQGSTIGYCFLTYKLVDDAKKAWKTLDGLNFHGHSLVARPARPTRDELTIAQRAYDEASKFRIMEETIQREAQLAAVMSICDSTNNIQQSNYPMEDLSNATMISDEQLINNPNKSSDSNYSSILSSHVHIPDLYGKLGLNQNSQTISKINSHNTTMKTCLSNINHHSRTKYPKEITTKTKTATTTASATAAIHRIEMALKNLEKTPIGGASALKPITNSQQTNPYAEVLLLKSTNLVNKSHDHSNNNSTHHHHHHHKPSNRCRTSSSQPMKSQKKILYT